MLAACRGKRWCLRWAAQFWVTEGNENRKCGNGAAAVELLVFLWQQKSRKTTTVCSVEQAQTAGIQSHTDRTFTQRETDRDVPKSEPIYTGHRHTHPHICDKEGIERYWKCRECHTKHSCECNRRRLQRVKAAWQLSAGPSIQQTAQHRHSSIVLHFAFNCASFLWRTLSVTSLLVNRRIQGWLVIHFTMRQTCYRRKQLLKSRAEECGRWISKRNAIESISCHFGLLSEQNKAADLICCMAVYEEQR